MTEKLTTLFLLTSSAAYLYHANQLAFGTLLNPMAGFVPILAGVIAVFTAIFVLFQQFRGKKAPVAEAVNWSKFIFISIGFLFYVAIFNRVGYFAATFIFLFYLFKVTDIVGWRFPFLFSLGTATILYILFKQYLSVALP